MKFKKPALEYALFLLKFRLRSKNEIIGKLREHKYEQDEIDEVISDLESHNLINDERFVKSFIRSRLEISRKGPYYIRMDLFKHGITDKDLIDKYLKEIQPEDELEIAKQLLESRKRQWSNLDPLAKKRRAISLLQRRGFGTKTISSLIKTWD
jgi:regulatory protein